MAFTALLLIALYVLVITLLVAAGAGVVAIAVIVAVLVLAHYLGTERLILSALAARPVGAGQAPGLQDAMERVCVLAGRPMVRLALVDSPVPNVFTVARSPLNATVCVTSGLLELLADDQLERGARPRARARRLPQRRADHARRRVGGDSRRTSSRSTAASPAVTGARSGPGPPPSCSPGCCSSSPT